MAAAMLAACDCGCEKAPNAEDLNPEDVRMELILCDME